MAHLVLQDVDPRVIEALSERAEHRGRTVEQEARTLLEDALGLSHATALESAQRLRQAWLEPLAPSLRLLREDSDRAWVVGRRQSKKDVGDLTSPAADVLRERG